MVDPGRADAVRQALAASGEEVRTIGTIVPGSGRPRVEFARLEALWPAGASPS